MLQSDQPAFLIIILTIINVEMDSNTNTYCQPKPVDNFMIINLAL